MKKRNIKTAIIIIVVLTFCLSFLTACVSGTGDKSVDTGGQTSSGSDEESPKEAKKEPVVVKIMTPETWAGAEFGYATGLPKVKEIEKRTGVIFEFEVYPREQYGQVFAARLAAGVDLPDIFDGIYDSDANLFRYAREGLFIPLNDLIEKYAPNIKRHYEVDYPNMKNYLADEDGTIYWLRRLHYSEGWDFEAIIYREDWAEKVGITKPPETTDEFYSFLKAVQDGDANGNGIKDEVLIAEADYRLLTGFSPAFGVICDWGSAGWQVNKNGEVFLSWITPEAKEFISYFNRLYKENLLSDKTPTIGTGDYQTYTEIFAQNAVAATCHFAYNAENYFPGLVKGVEGVKYSVLKPLIGPQGHRYFYKMPPVPEGGKFVITRDCKNPEAVIKLYDFAMSEEGRLLTNYGLEGVHWERNEEGLVVQTKQWQETLEKDPDAGNKFGSIYFMPTWSYIDFKQVSINWKREDIKNTVAEIIKMPYLEKIELGAPKPEQQEVLDLYESEMRGYVWSMVYSFIRGEEPLSKWDDYVKRVYDLGYEKVKPIMQARYDKLYK